MPSARNTSKPATVRRFNGGQYQNDDSDPKIGKLYGRAKQPMTLNMDGPAKTHSPSKYAAHVGGGHPKGRLASFVESDETLGQRSIMIRAGAPIAGNSGPSRVKNAAAHVGGGHPRTHQG